MEIFSLAFLYYSVTLSSVVFERKMTLDLQQLYAFRTIAALGHMTQAASQLALSQPALSRSLARLEEELGFPLFHRCHKRLELTRSGRIFLEHLDQGLQRIEAGRQQALDLIHPERGSVSLSFLHSQGTHLVPELLQQFRRLHPQVHFRLYQNSTAALLEQLHSGGTDLCLCSFAAPPPYLAWRPLFEEDIFVAVHREHPLAQQESLSLQDIAVEPLITFKPNYGLRLLADRLLQQAGVQPEITFEGEEIMTVAGLVEARLGVALIPHLAGLEHLHLAFLPVKDTPCRRTIGLAWHKERYLSPAALKFRDFVLERH